PPTELAQRHHLETVRDGDLPAVFGDGFLARRARPPEEPVRVAGHQQVRLAELELDGYLMVADDVRAELLAAAERLGQLPGGRPPSLRLGGLFARAEEQVALVPRQLAGDVWIKDEKIALEKAQAQQGILEGRMIADDVHRLPGSGQVAFEFAEQGDRGE